jgi:hypothetical protein
MPQGITAQEDVITVYDHYVELTKWIFPVAVDANNQPKYFVKMTVVMDLESIEEAPKITAKADKIKKTITEFCATITDKAYFDSGEGIYKTKNMLKDLLNEVFAPIKIKQVLISDIVIR